MTKKWYYAICDEQKGPVSTKELQEMMSRRQLSADDLVWTKGLDEWQQIAQIPELNFNDEQGIGSQEPPMSNAAFDAQIPTHSPSQKSQATPPPQPAVWYYTSNGQQHGPVTSKFLKEQAAAGLLSPQDLLWKTGLKDWVIAGSLSGLHFPHSPQPVQQIPQTSATTQSHSSQAAVSAMPQAAPTTETPDEKSIFDVMNDPEFSASPALPSASNSALVITPETYVEVKKRKRKKNKSHNGFVMAFDISDYTDVIIWVTFALIFLGVSIWHHFYLVDLKNHGIVAEARIVDIEESRGRRGRRYYHPIVNFQMENGRYMQVKTSSGSGYQSYHVGDIVEVIYLEENPEGAEIVGSSALSSTFNFWTFAMGICLVMACYRLFRKFLD